MDFIHSDKVKALQEKLAAFMEAEIYPNEARHEGEMAAGDRWRPTAVLEELRPRPGWKACGTCSCPTRRAAPVSAISNTRRSARSWGVR